MSHIKFSERSSIEIDCMTSYMRLYLHCPQTFPHSLTVNCHLPVIDCSISDTKLEEIVYLFFALSQHLLRILSQHTASVAAARQHFHHRHTSLDLAHLTSTSVLTPQPFTNYRDVQKLRNRANLNALTRSRLRATFSSSISMLEDTDR